jgi:hypothetical protein
MSTEESYQKGYRDGLHDTWNPPHVGPIPSGRNADIADAYRDGFRPGKAERAKQKS